MLVIIKGSTPLIPNKLIEKLRKHLSQPLTRGLDLDDPKTTELRKKILTENKFLYKVYDEWYSQIICNLPLEKNPILEIGSGAGFLNERIPKLILSDILYYPGLSLVANAGELPFISDSLGAIILINTFHHIPDVSLFLSEVGRTLKRNGRLIMIEPWVTRWSSWVYRNLHHEPFDPSCKEWKFPTSGPLSSANSALPWIVFQRDFDLFHQKYQELDVLFSHPYMPFLYLLSGGISMRPLLPEWIFGLSRSLDSVFCKIFKSFAMFGLLVIEKTKDD